MSASGNITIDSPKIRAIVQTAVVSGLVASADLMVTKIKASMSNKKGPSAPGTPPAVGMNALLRNGIARTDPKNNEVYVHTSQVRYARAHEFGVTITPKKSQYLAVPLSYQARRLSARTSVDGNGSLRNSATPLFVMKSRKGNLLLVARTKWGKGKSRIKSGEPLFVLKKSVTLKARPYMKPALQWVPEVMRTFSIVARRAVAKAFR